MGGISFRKINTQLYTALIGADLTRACYKILLLVIHFTLGYNQRTEAGISLKTFSDYTGLSKTAVKHALKLLQGKNIIRLVSKADNRNSAVYNLNTNFTEWTTGKACLSSRVKAGLSPKDVKTYPPDVQNLPPRGKVFTPATPDIKKKRKLLNKTITPPETSSIKRDVSTTPPMSLSLNAPKGKAKANSLTNGYTVLPEKGRATLESDLSVSGSPSRGKSHRERIMAYLGAHGPAAIKTIAQATGIDANSVNLTLHNGKGKRFLHLAEQRAWSVAGKDTPLTDTEWVPADDNGDKIGASNRERIIAYLGTHGPSPIKDLVRELGLTAKQVTRVLDRYRDKYFRHYKESHLWGNTSELSPKRDIKPVKVLRGRPIIFETIDLINRKGTA